MLTMILSYDSICGEWIEASSIPGSESGFNLSIQPDVAIQGPNGEVTSGIIATWVNGQGNDAEIF